MRPLYADPPNPVTRKRISEFFDLGVKAINTTLTVYRVAAYKTTTIAKPYAKRNDF